MTPVEYFTSAAAIVTLLWSVVNEIRLREHAKALQTNEAHLRVRAEMQLRLHQQAWDLLREFQAASFVAYEALRSFQTAVISGQANGRPFVSWETEYAKAFAAVQRVTGLALVAPPDKKALRAAGSAFTKALNTVNGSCLAVPAPVPSEQLEKTIAILTEALTLAASGTAEWNKELWQHQTLEGLVPKPKALKPKPE